MSSRFRVAFTGGATGGHIYPNLAVAAALREIKPELDLYYFGHPEKLEADLLVNPQVKDDKGISYSSYIEFVPVSGQPLPSARDPFKFIPWSLHFMQETARAKSELKQRAVNVVFGTGGYIAGPVFKAAQELKILYILHNLDAHLGLANKMFLNDATYISLAFPISGLSENSGKIRVIGNPVSSKFFMPHSAERLTNTGMRELHILVTGGSQGAQAINDLIGGLLESLKYLTGESLKLKIKHITGKANYESYALEYLGGQVHKYEELYFHYELMPYAHNMPELCNWADLAICRSGAMTIAEMAASGTVPLFLPLPTAANDHQNKNAKFLVDKGAALSFDQKDLLVEDLVLNALKQLIAEPDLLPKMRANLKPFANRDAARQLAELILSVS